MKPGFAISLISTTGLLASLLLACVHPFGNAGLYAPHDLAPAFLQDPSMPPKVREILSAKCANCHSLQTRAPLYGRFAPASWLMEHDVVEAREAMNLSRWANYPASDREAFKAKILLEIRANEMPPLQYRVIHWKARVTDADIQELAQWVRGSSAPNAVSVTQVSGEADAVRGKAVFQRRCTGCHALDQNREGPRLANVFGRTAGSVPNFGYSAALKNSHLVWNEEALEKWLADPDAFVPNNNMEFRVVTPQERRDLIRFLKDGPS